MCGRKFSHEELTWAEYRDMLGIVQSPPATNFQPNYNITPSQFVPVCINVEGKRVLDDLHWGLVPTWAKDTKFAAKMINARAETLEEKPSFQPLLNDKRCIVMVSGFYEWKRDGNQKTPYKVERSDAMPMMLGGLWTQNDRLGIDSYSIITTSAPGDFAAIHHRAPLILDENQIDVWMNESWDQAKHLTEPYSGSIRATQVSSDVNNARNNYRRLLQPIDTVQSENP